jgi:hypothetical protein
VSARGGRVGPRLPVPDAMEAASVGRGSPGGKRRESRSPGRAAAKPVYRWAERAGIAVGRC